MAFVLALIVWLLTAVTVWLLADAKSSMPAAISEAARGVDAQFFLTLVITGVAFVSVQGLLGLFILKYRERAGARARYIRGSNLVEVGGLVVVAVVFISLAVLGQRVWAKLHLREAAANPVVVEITGEQFAWNVRYPGPDGRFGRTSPQLYDPLTNPVGLVADDPAGGDDVVVLNTLAVPVDRPVELQLGSKDVLHGFFMPVLRIKQDTVPGIRVPLRFMADQIGDFEIACAELCGLGHYRMRGFLQVMEESEFESWLAEQAAE